jgi:hypothetical protein
MLCVVEGEGEQDALPVLLRRLVPHLIPGGYADFVRPWRVHAGSLFQGNWGKVESAVAEARAKGYCAVLLVLDTDCEGERCPLVIAGPLLSRLQNLAPDLHVGLVLAECEFETWFIEAAESLRGQRGLPQDLERPANPLIRDAKGWIGERMPKKYRETLDQAALAAVMDIEVARQNSRSFRKLCDEILRLYRAC